MKLLSVVFALVVPFVAGCSGQALKQPSLPALPAPSIGGDAAAKIGSNATAQNVYWTLFYAQPNPQVEIAKLPLKATSQVTRIDGNGDNQFVCANAIRSVGSKLWVMNLSPCHASDSSIVQVYSLPLTTHSKPTLTFVLSGPVDGDHMTFDASGNLWVSSEGNNTVYEYTGPFTSSGTLQPAKRITLGLKTPQGLGFDSKGRLFVANTGTTSGKNAIAIFKPPISNSNPQFLKGVIAPSGLIFDHDGNLYVSSNGTTGAIAQYASNHLTAGDSPSVVDSKGIAPGEFGADLNFDSAGNLYDADCGDKPGIYSYPTATKSFSSTLAPSFYTNKSIKSIGCVWGIAIH